MNRDTPYGILNQEIDTQWAYQYSQTPKVFNPYFDYYFTGQDIQVYIDGIEGTDLPIMGLAFDVEQQKAPIYGFWNYTFSAVMRGTRLVSGVMNLFTESTDYLIQKLSEAATARKTASSTYPIRGLDMDEQNIELYWGKNLNAGVSNYGENKNIFNAHPPFNLVIIYGIQSINQDGLSQQANSNGFGGAPSLLSDINERLVTGDQENPMRIVLENVEITKVHVEYQPDGTPLMESYSFFARDIIIPRSNDAPASRTPISVNGDNLNTY